MHPSVTVCHADSKFIAEFVFLDSVCPLLLLLRARMCHVCCSLPQTQLVFSSRRRRRRRMGRRKRRPRKLLPLSSSSSCLRHSFSSPAAPKTHLLSEMSDSSCCRSILPISPPCLPDPTPTESRARREDRRTIIISDFMIC